ncbi:MAG: hypothetical protein AAFP00_12590, partial [Bacteroidota bacterium]
ALAPSAKGTSLRIGEEGMISARLDNAGISDQYRFFYPIGLCDNGYIYKIDRSSQMTEYQCVCFSRTIFLTHYKVYKNRSSLWVLKTLIA